MEFAICQVKYLIINSKRNTYIQARVFNSADYKSSQCGINRKSWSLAKPFAQDTIIHRAPAPPLDAEFNCHINEGQQVPPRRLIAERD